MTDLLTLPETAEATRTPEATLRYWRHKGTGPRSFRIGRRVMYKREDVEAWVQTQYAQQPTSPRSVARQLGPAQQDRVGDLLGGA